MVNELVRSGQMRWDEAKTSRYRSVITRAIGLYPTVQADVMSIEVLPGDRIVLNSDGLSDPVPATVIEAIAGQHAIDEVCDRLVQAALDVGAPDNVTAIVVEPDATLQSETTRARAQVLDELFLFQDMPFHARLRVSRICEERSHATGEVLVRQDDPGDSMYVVVQGEVCVTIDGREVTRFGAGEHFGELSLVDEQPRSATVTAATAGSSISIRRQQLQDFCQREPDLGNLVMWRLLATLGSRLRETNRQTSRLVEEVRQAADGDGAATR